MKRNEGLHFYINVANFDEVVADEEAKQHKLAHCIHALDTLFTSIERYGKRNYESLHVEKVTGSRLHLYDIDDEDASFAMLTDIVRFAQELTGYINKNIPKYKTLLNFKIQVGACYGHFYDFVFKDKEVEEETTIGFAANYAAKLQALAPTGNLAVSEAMYDSLSKEAKEAFTKVKNEKIKKYKQECFYEARITALPASNASKADFDEVYRYANDVNLSSMNFRSATKPVSLQDLSKTECKQIYGVPLFADVRGFTAKFDDKDANLEEMAQKTQKILSSMYHAVVEHKGIHVQFQGDREFALFHNYSKYNACEVDAVVVGLRIIDAVKPYRVSVGVGESVGDMFAARIGARGEKDIVVLGKTVQVADSMEDDCAKENQLAISKEVYEALQDNRPQLSKIFKKVGGENPYYITEKSYSEYSAFVAESHLNNSNRSSSYNPAWGE